PRLPGLELNQIQPLFTVLEQEIVKPQQDGGPFLDAATCPLGLSRSRLPDSRTYIFHCAHRNVPERLERERSQHGRTFPPGRLDGYQSGQSLDPSPVDAVIENVCVQVTGGSRCGSSHDYTL